MLGKNLIQAAAGNVGGGASSDSYVCMTGISDNFIDVYQFSSISGFGSKYTSPSGLVWQFYNASFAPSGTTLAAGSRDTAAGIYAWQWSSSGFGTQYTSPAQVYGSLGTYGCDFHPSENAVGSCGYFGDSIAVYAWSSSTGFGTKYNPTSVTGWHLNFKWHPDGTYFFVTKSVSPYISAYPWSGSAIGTAVSDPATLPTARCYGLAVSPDGDSVVLGQDSSTLPILGYPWTGSGFGTKYSNPATLPPSSGTHRGVHFTPDSSVVFVTGNASPYINAYPFTTGTSGGFGTKYSNPSTGLSNTAIDVRVTPDGNAVIVASNASPYLDAYAWSNSTGFGTKFSNPSTLPNVGSSTTSFVTVGPA